MIKKRLTNPNLKMLKKDFFDLSKISALALNCTIGDEITEGQKYQFVCDFNCAIKQIYQVNGKVYALTENCEIIEYDKKSNEFNLIASDVQGLPSIVGIKVDGNDLPLVITENGSFISDEERFMPYGKYTAVYRGSCFTAQDHSIYFSDAFNFETFTFGEYYGTLKTDVKDGLIVGMDVLGTNLFVLCEHAIYKVRFYDSILFALERQKVTVSDIESDSVKSVGGKIMFISEGKIYSFDGNSISQIQLPLTDERIEFLGKAQVLNDKYCPLITVDKELAQLVFSEKEKTFTVCGVPSTIVSDGGLILDGTSVYKGYFDDGKSTGQIVWQSDKIYMQTQSRKTLNEITVFARGVKTFTVSGEFGKSEYFLQDGINKLVLNCTSSWFKFSATGNEQFNLKNLSVKFRIIGE